MVFQNVFVTKLLNWYLAFKGNISLIINIKLHFLHKYTKNVFRYLLCKKSMHDYKKSQCALILPLRAQVTQSFPTLAPEA